MSALPFQRVAHKHTPGPQPKSFEPVVRKHPVHRLVLADVKVKLKKAMGADYDMGSNSRTVRPHWQLHVRCHRALSLPAVSLGLLRRTARREMLTALSHQLITRANSRRSRCPTVLQRHTSGPALLLLHILTRRVPAGWSAVSSVHSWGVFMRRPRQRLRTTAGTK